MINDPLGIARGSRSVVERDGVPFIPGHQPGELRRGTRQETLVIAPAQKIAAPSPFRVIDIDDDQRRTIKRDRLSRGLREFAVGDQNLRLAMAQDKGDRLGIEARIDRVEDAACERHTEMSLKEFRRVGGKNRNRIARGDTRPAQRGRKPTAARIGFRPSAPNSAMDDRGPIGPDAGRTFEKGQGGQRRVICRVAFQVAQVGVCSVHDFSCDPLIQAGLNQHKMARRGRPATWPRSGMRICRWSSLPVMIDYYL